MKFKYEAIEELK